MQSQLENDQGQKISEVRFIYYCQTKKQSEKIMLKHKHSISNTPKIANSVEKCHSSFLAEIFRSQEFGYMSIWQFGGMLV